MRTSIGGFEDENIGTITRAESTWCRQIATLARVGGNTQLALSMSKLVFDLERATRQLSFASVIEYSQALWGYGQHSPAQQLLQRAYNNEMVFADEPSSGDLADSLTQMVSPPPPCCTAER